MKSKRRNLSWQAVKEDETGLKNAGNFYFGPVAANSSPLLPRLSRIVLGVQM